MADKEVNINASHIQNAVIGTIKHWISATSLERKISLEDAKVVVSDELAQALRNEGVSVITVAHLERVDKMIAEMDIEEGVRGIYLEVIKIIRESI